MVCRCTRRRKSIHPAQLESSLGGYDSTLIKGSCTLHAELDQRVGNFDDDLAVALLKGSPTGVPSNRLRRPLTWKAHETFPVIQAKPTLAARARARRTDPISPKPISIIAHVAGSGTAPGPASVRNAPEAEE